MKWSEIAKFVLPIIAGIYPKAEKFMPLISDAIDVVDGIVQEQASKGKKPSGIQKQDAFYETVSTQATVHGLDPTYAKQVAEHVTALADAAKAAGEDLAIS